MFRRATVASATLALTALAVACGRQVTPNPVNGSGNLTGKMAIIVRTNGAMDFNNIQYQIVINTCGTGEPYPNPKTTSFYNYSYIFSIGQGIGGIAPQLQQIILEQGSSSALQPETVPYNASLDVFQPVYNGQPNQFELIFSRAQLANALGVSQPCPGQTQPTPSSSSVASSSATPTASAGASPSSAPTASVSATLTPTASPTPSPSPSPTSSSGATPVPYATSSGQIYWFINFFTAQNGVILDSLGSGGPNDTTYYQPIDTTMLGQTQTPKNGGAAPPPSNSAAQLQGGEIDNYP